MIGPPSRMPPDRTLALPRLRGRHLPAQADAVADFYRGKQISLVIGTSAGNDYDFRGRLIARHMGRHIPGEPDDRAAQHAGRRRHQRRRTGSPPSRRSDGTTLHMIMTNMMAAQAIGTHGVQFDTRKFRWIGNTTSTPNVTNSWYTSGITNIEQTKTRELILGAPAGHRGRDLRHGDERARRHQVQDRHRLSGRQRGQPRDGARRGATAAARTPGRRGNRPSREWIAQKKIIMLVQVGLKRDPDLPDVPLLLELVNNDLDRKVMTFLSAETAISRALVTTPDVPAERVEALRRAFDATMKDPHSWPKPTRPRWTSAR